MNLPFARTLGHDRVDDLVARAPARDELRDHLGRVLEVAVHREDRLAAGEIETGGERELMPEPAREADDLEARVARVSLDGEPVRAVGAPVVDEDHLPGVLERVEHTREARDELWQQLLLVPEGNDDRKARSRVVHSRRG